MKLPSFMQDKGDYAKPGELSLKGIGIVILTSVMILFLVIGAIAWKINSYNCHVAETRYHKATKYILFAGCYIDAEHGNWSTLGQYQNFHQVKP